VPKPRTYQTEAIIIRKTKLGEADRVLTLYTPDLGKIQGIAKGVRRPKAKLSGHLELLTHSHVTLVRGRNLDTIIGSQTIDSFLPLKTDLLRSACALYAAEMVSQFAPADQENRPLFSLLLETLGDLATGDRTDLRLRHYELRLLDTVGYRPQLQQCVDCHRPLLATRASFSASAGGALCADCDRGQSFSYPLTPTVLNALQQLQGHPWGEVRQIELDNLAGRQLEMVVRHYVRYLLEHDVRSTEWLDTVRRIEPIV